MFFSKEHESKRGHVIDEDVNNVLDFALVGGMILVAMIIKYRKKREVHTRHPFH